MVPLGYYLALSAVLFVLGTIGALVRRNVIMVLMAIELMLNAASLSFVALARHLASIDGQVVVLFVIVVAGTEAVVGLTMIVQVFRVRRTVNLDDVSLLRG